MLFSPVYTYPVDINILIITLMFFYAVCNVTNVHCTQLFHSLFTNMSESKILDNSVVKIDWLEYIMKRMTASAGILGNKILTTHSAHKLLWNLHACQPNYAVNWPQKYPIYQQLQQFRWNPMPKYFNNSFKFNRSATEFQFNQNKAAFQYALNKSGATNSTINKGVQNLVKGNIFGRKTIVTPKMIRHPPQKTVCDLRLWHRWLTSDICIFPLKSLNLLKCMTFLLL